MKKIAVGFVSGMRGAILALTLLWLVTVRVPTAIWFGNFTLNAYLTGLVALMAGSLALLTFIFFVTKNPPQGRSFQETPKALVVVSLSGLPLLIYSGISLGLDFRIEGLQNTLVWAAFSLTLFSLPYWLSSTYAVLAKKVLRVVAIVVPVTKIITFYGGFDFYGEASYALVAVILLAYAVSQTPRSWFDFVTPWLLLSSILLCDVRTAAVVGSALMVFSVKHFEVSSKLRTFLAFIIALAAGSLVWLVLGDRFMNPGDSGLAQFFGQDSILAGVGTTNRGSAWAFILENLPAETNWFGQGAGESSFLADELLGIHHPHNEYLRIFYDFGWVGFGLFLAGSVALFLAALNNWKTSRSDLAMSSSLLIPAVELMAITDNPLVFVYVMVPAAAIIALGFHDSRHEN